METGRTGIKKLESQFLFNHLVQLLNPRNKWKATQLQKDYNMRKMILLSMMLVMLSAFDVAAVDPAIEAAVADVNQQQYENYQLEIESMGLGLYGGATYDQGFRNRDGNAGPGTLGNQEARLYLIDEFTAMGLTTSVQGAYLNVVGEITGTVSPKTVFVIGAHYDHEGGDMPGGDDNASGTAAVLEAARILSQYQFESTIRFICFNAEEDGLLGSADYVASLSRKQKNDMDGLINMDMILRPGSDAHPERPIDLELETNGSGAWVNLFVQATADYVPSILIGDIWDGADSWSDNDPFQAEGIPSLLAIENSDNDWYPPDTANPYYHTTNDASDRLANNGGSPSGITYDYTFATDVTRICVALIAQEAVITGSTTPDTTAPTPNPLTWVTPPYAIGTSSIAMAASTATDSENGVQYKFICTAGDGNNSAWLSSPSYTDTNLSGGYQYTYTVIARDTSSNHNTTSSSVEASATTDLDSGLPTPNPMTWATAPYAILGGHKVAMTATTASDPSGVEYYFTCTAGGGNDSGWQGSPTYQDTGLIALTEYTYTVTVRDKSTSNNTTGASTAASVTTTGINLVAPGDGGLLESFTSEYSAGWGNATMLTDGGTNQIGWCSAQNPVNPQEFVYSFLGGQDATLNEAIIHGGTAEGQYYSKDVEVWISTNGTDYTLQGSGTLLDVDNDSVTIDLGGVVAKKVKLAITDGYVNGWWEMSEFQLFGEIGGGSADTDPPTPNPAGFASAPSADSDTAISMTATTGSDASGPVEYLFTETSGNSGGSSSVWQTSTSYTDSGLTAATQYTYTVTMRDSLGNTGSASVGASATTTGGGCTATDIHIDAMSAARVGNCGQNKKMGEATVTIVDDCGNPVAGALVDITFSGDFSESFTDVATDANGVATATTVACVKNANFTATVTDVTGSLPYDSNDDVTSSASN